MIVLLTDFGQSEYVGVMKGVIHSIAPNVQIVDLCHSISPQSIIEGSWILKNNYRYFPKGAIFCCVVDPGVGTNREAVAARTGDYYFVGPDNGLLWETLKEQSIAEIRQIPLPKEASRTFHGRDVFAKAAAEIESGSLATIGEAVQQIEELELYREDRKGIVVRIDEFGNIVTNISNEQKDRYSVTIDGKEYTMPFYPTYHSASEDELFLIEGSNSTLEISLRNGSANGKLRVKAGTKVEIS